MSVPLNEVVDITTKLIVERSKNARFCYEERMEKAQRSGRGRRTLSCGNLAHAFAAFPLNDKLALLGDGPENIGIVTSYNDVLSAHRPFSLYPDTIKNAAREAGGTAQVAGGVHPRWTVWPYDRI
jgi:phosphogluconate dehydratase